MVASFVGFKNTEKTIGAINTINFNLADDTALLQEVVVTGFGEKARKAVTTSIV